MFVSKMKEYTSRCADIVFFFKQKTAYEVRISDWSSDVCSSDLGGIAFGIGPGGDRRCCGCSPGRCPSSCWPWHDPSSGAFGRPQRSWARDRKSVVYGKSVSVRVDLGGRRLINKKVYTVKPSA